LTGGSDVDGTEYAGALSQRVFQTVASAADDMAAVFADDTPELMSLFVVWALQVLFKYFLNAYGLPSNYLFHLFRESSPFLFLT
jgi:hypothetical protein